MPYAYDDQKPWVFSDEGQRALLRGLDFLRQVLPHAGAVTSERLCNAVGGFSVLSKVDEHQRRAIVDRLVELNLLRPVGPGLRADDIVYVPVAAKGG
jgi:hypothetical protein